MNVQRLSDNADEIRNIVTCLGAGSGLAQLQVVLRDEESIAAYGELPGVFQDASCETIEDLTAAGRSIWQPMPGRRKNSWSPMSLSGSQRLSSFMAL